MRGGRKYFFRPIVRAMVAVAVILFVVFFGTVAYMIVEGLGFFDAAYQTLIVISTLGIKDSTSGRAGAVVTLFLIVVGIGAVAYAVSLIASIVVEGELRAVLGRRKVSMRIANLQGHYIICGYGRMGRQVCDMLKKSGMTCVAVEVDPTVTAKAENDGFLYVLGNAHDENILKAAGINNAAGVVTALRSDADNVFVTLTARDMNSTVPIVARAEDQETVSKLRRAGATRVISPHSLGANRIACMLTNPEIAEFMDAASAGEDLEMGEVTIPEESVLVGKTLHDAGFRDQAGVLIISIARREGGRVFSPGSNTELLAGDRLLCIGELGARQRLRELAGVAV